MKLPIFITLLSFVICSFSHAEIPEKKPALYYSKLWTESPFTTKPPEIKNNLIGDPFKDYHLTGIAPVEGGYRITIANKKDKKKTVIEPGSTSKFKVISVKRNPEISLGTVVTLDDGRVQGEVRFEPTLVVLNTPTTAKPVNQVPPSTPTAVNPEQPNNGEAVQPPPRRPRVVPPSKPTPKATNDNSQTRPKPNQ
jgi:hypothetical protein